MRRSPAVERGGFFKVASAFAGIGAALERLWGKSSPRPEPSSRDAPALDSSVMGTDTRRLRQPVEADTCIAANRLACYVSALRERDDTFRLRVILHDFGLVWADADNDERAVTHDPHVA